MANFLFLAETGFLHVGQAGLQLPTSGDSPTWSSQSAGIIDMSHHAQPCSGILKSYRSLASSLHSLWLLSCHNGRVSSWDQDCTACKLKHLLRSPLEQRCASPCLIPRDSDIHAENPTSQGPHSLDSPYRSLPPRVVGPGPMKPGDPRSATSILSPEHLPP